MKNTIHPHLTNPMIQPRPVLTAAALLWLTCVSAPALNLPQIFADNMVLQQGRPVPVWGGADKGEDVTVTLAGQSATTKTGDDGRWKVVLKELKPAADPLDMAVTGSSGKSITLKNILVGEVWVCSGQSNMAIGVAGCNDAKEEVAAANYPKIRLISVPETKAGEPASGFNGSWSLCSPQRVAAGGWAGYSAVAYYFGRQLHQDLKVPVGLIQTTWGGTPIDFWTSRKALEANPALKPLIQGESSCLYNGMIAPLIPYAIRGAIWYQGEADVPRAYQYRTLLPAMIANWRADWGQGDFPFGIVQLAPYRYGDQNPVNCAELWEAQSLTVKNVPNTGLAGTMDIGNLKDIHPLNKQDVGKRLALWAMAKVYGKDLVYSGPIYKSMAVEANKIRLQFDHTGGGLTASGDKPLVEFTIAGADQKFVPATATIDGASIVVQCDQVAQPVAVRYAWHDDAQPNLTNKEGLPASPFRTDTWKCVTDS